MRSSQISIILGVLVAPALASAQIGQPGAHPRYEVELEPHVLAEWDNSAPCQNDGLGAGLRAVIPFLQDGPVPAINNNMGIGFGLDYAHYSANSCSIFQPIFTGSLSASVWTIPVVLHWNFFLLPKISVFGEFGVVWQHWSWDTPYACASNPQGVCSGSTSTNQLNVAPAAGGRFMVTDKFGFLLRLGWPYVSAGAVFWM